MIHQHITTTEIFHSTLPKFNIQHGWKPSSPTPHRSLTTLHRNNQSRAEQRSAAKSNMWDSKGTQRLGSPTTTMRSGTLQHFDLIKPPCGSGDSVHVPVCWNFRSFISWLTSYVCLPHSVCSFHLFQNPRNSLPEGQTEEERNPGQTWSNHPLQRYNRTTEWRWMSALLLQLNTFDLLKHLQSFHRLQTTAWNCSRQNGEFKQKAVFQAGGGASGSSKE